MRSAIEWVRTHRELIAMIAKRLGIVSEGERPQGTGPVLVKG